MKNGYKFHRFQIEDVYNRIFPLLSDQELYSIKQDYLKRSKIKPKLIFPVIKDKTIRSSIIDFLEVKFNLDRTTLYKNSIILEDVEEYFVILYQSDSQKIFIIKKEDI